MGTLLPQLLDATPPATLAFGAVAGGGAGLAVALVVILVLRGRAKTSTATQILLKETWLPFVSTLLVTGVWVGLNLTEMDPVPDWFEDVQHALLLLAITVGAWLAYAAAGLFGEPAILTNVKTGRDARRFRTQAQILRRVAQAATIGLALVLALLTFPEARAPMVSVLASAGLLSVVVGLAAQSSLGNMFAGVQLALTDAIRVGDTVVWPAEPEPGAVEEITLTYVVVRIWDGRRIILPSSEFTTKPFENWTRTEVAQLARTHLELDWTAPLAEIRAEIGRLVEESPLWDGQVWSVQVFAVTANYLEVRVVVSAKNWARAWDLRSYVRENIVAWIEENAPWSVPRDYVSMVPSGMSSRPWGTEGFDPAALSDAQYVGPAGGGSGAKWGASSSAGDPDVTVQTQDERLRGAPSADADQATHRKAGHKRLGRFLFSGSKEADKRAELYSGPGDDVLEQRKQRAEADKQAAAAIPVTRQ